MSRIDSNRKLKLLGWSLHGLGASLAILMTLFATFVVYRPLDTCRVTCTRRVDELRTFLQDKSKMRAEHARLSKELAVARQQAATLQARIPDEPRKADFLAQASELAGEVGLRIQDYRPGKAAPRHTLSVMQVDLICRGDYTSICSFLHRLTELPRYSTVVRLQIDADDGLTEHFAKISLTLYFGTPGPSDASAQETTDA